MSRSSRSTWLEFARVGQMQARDADHGVGLVDGPIGAHPQIVFWTALARAERGGAVIAGSRVDPIEHDHVFAL